MYIISIINKLSNYNLRMILLLLLSRVQYPADMYSRGSVSSFEAEAISDHSFFLDFSFLD